MNQVLFATTNRTKIDRIKRLVRDLPLRIISLSDIDVKIKEPSELGNGVVGVAVAKAQYYLSATNYVYPVLAQDDCMDFLGKVSVEDDPSVSIKSPVIRKFGVFNNETAIKYYSAFAKKYGGGLDFAFRYGHALARPDRTKSASSSLSAKLVSEPKGVDKVGNYPLRALTKVNINGEFVYSTDISEEDHIMADHDIRRALVEIFHDFI